MSIQILTVRQLLEIFEVLGIYFAVTLFLPAIVFYQKVCHMRFSERFMVYQTAGNFYIIFQVALLQVFPGSGALLLRLFTLFSVVLYLMIVLCRKVFCTDSDRQKRTAGNFFAACAGHIWYNLGEIALLCIVAAIVLAVYDGTGYRSYHMSDLAAYNSWIYDMRNGQAALDGVKPLWCYSMIYYLHTVFWLDEFMLFRAFWIVQTLLVYFMLIAFLRVCCKLRYSAYAGVGIYVLAVYAGSGVYGSAAGTQFRESGMIFVLLPAAFLFLFFEKKKQETEGEPDELRKEAEMMDADGEDRQVFLLDEVLAQTAEREAAVLAGEENFPAADEREASEEVVLIMEENATDGTISIKECPLDGTISIQDISIDEIADRASENIPLVDLEHPEDKTGNKNSGYGFRKRFGKDSTKCLVLFTLAFGMALSVSEGLAAAAGIFCIAACAGYCFRFFRIRYLWRVVLAGLLSFVLPAAFMCFADDPGGMWQRVAEVFTAGGKPLLWTAVPSYLLRMGSRWQNLAILLSIGLLLFLSLIYFIIRRTDYAARMLSVVFFMAGMTLLIGASGLGGIPQPENQRECIRLFYTYSLVIVWGLCIDGVMQMPVYCFRQLRWDRE